jgi:branched-chain amino acid transport system ATP-binding protein
LEIILEYVDQVYAMSGGRIIAEGRDKEILENPEVVEVYHGAES